MSSQYKHLQFRRGKQSEFADADPILKDGEPAWSSDYGDLRIGDGNSKWSELSPFTRSDTARVSANIPSIQANTSVTLTFTVPNLSTNNEYGVICTPDSTLPDYVSIKYAYVSAENTVSVIFTNTNMSSIDGNGFGFSVATNNVKLHLLIYLTYLQTTTTTTTTTPDPYVDDVFSFGYNEFGQLGQSDKTDRHAPTMIYDGGTKWSKFSLGHYHSLGIDAYNELYSVGYNYYGQLGLGNNGVGTNRLSLQKVYGDFQFKNGLDYEDNITHDEVEAGEHHSLVLSRKDGVRSYSLFSCGDGSYGALGVGDTKIRNTFTLVGENRYYETLTNPSTLNISNESISINGKDESTRFILQKGVTRITNSNPSEPITIMCDASEHILSYTGGTLSNTIGGQRYYSDYLDIDVSGYFDSASINTLNGGYLSNGENIFSWLDENRGWFNAAAGSHYSLGIKYDKVYSWGNNSFGQLGNGSHKEYSAPTLIPTLPHISTDQKELDVRLNDETNPVEFTIPFIGPISVSCIGQFIIGVLECDPFTVDGGRAGSSCENSRPIKVKIPKSDGSISIEDVSSLCYFNNEIENNTISFFMNDSNYTDNVGTVHLNVMHGPKPKKVSCGDSHSLVLYEDGSVYAFGNNSHGQLGLGSQETHIKTPEKITFDFTSYTDSNITILPNTTNLYVDSQATGDFYVLNYAETGDGVKTPYNSLERFVLEEGTYVIKNVPQENPIAILNAGNEENISYSGDELADCITVVNTTADGKYNFYYGDVYITVAGNFDKVSIYGYYGGYMGGKNILLYHNPDYVIKDIATGFNHSVLLTQSDQVLTFGRNDKGQLGTGDTVSRNFPFRLGESNITKIDAGGNHSLLVNEHKRIFAFGENSRGQLGLSDNVNRLIPEAMESFTKIRWQDVYCGASHSFATVFCFYPTAPTITGLKNANDSSLIGHRQLIVDYNHARGVEEGVIKHIIEVSSDSGATWETVDSEAFKDLTQSPQFAFNYIFDGLDDNSSYRVRIAAINDAGQGPYAYWNTDVSPTEAQDPDFSSVQLYSHLDENNIQDLGPSGWNAVEFYETDAPRFSDGEFSEALRLHRYDGMYYETTDMLINASYTLEFFWNPRGYAQNAELLRIKDDTNTWLRMVYNGQEETGFSLAIQKQGGETILNLDNQVIENFAHIAVTRTSGLQPNPENEEFIKLYFNGTLVDSGRDNNAYDAQYIIFGSGDSSSYYDFEVDELRLSNINRYEDTTFNVTKKPFGLT